MAVGAAGENSNTGAVWILFMNEDRTVKGQQKINETEGNFIGNLNTDDVFGWDIASIGDFNSDGIPDIAVGANGDSDGGAACGAVWLLFLNSDGTVKSHRKISATVGGLVGLTQNRRFGAAVTNLGDLNYDGITDLAVGSPLYNDEGGNYRGCVWILFLNADGTVKSQQKINDYQGGLGSVLSNGDKFGYAVENIGDINNDGITDLAVGASEDDDGNNDAGAIYILFLDTDGTIKGKEKIKSLEGNFNGQLNSGDAFGYKLGALGDIDGNGVGDIITCSSNSDDGGLDRGKAWILYLEDDGTVSDYNEIGSLTPGFENQLDNSDRFGMSFTVFGGVNENGNKEIVIGAAYDDDGASNAGAVYIMDLNVKHKPVAITSNDQKLCFSEHIIIDGLKSSVLDNDTLCYSWSCENYELTDSTLEQFEFIAPLVDVLTTYEFLLNVQCEGVRSETDTVVITVYPKLQKPVVTQDRVTLSTVDANSYQWYLNGKIIPGAVNEEYTAKENGQFRVLLSDEFGCSVMSDILDVNVIPIAKILAPKKVCSGNVLNLNGSGSFSTVEGEFTYLWSSNLMTVPNAQLLETSFIAPKLEISTDYDFYLVVSQNGIESVPDTISVTINPAPTRPAIEQFADTLRASSAINYQWFLNENEIYTTKNQIYVVEQSGSYYVKVSNGYGCVSDPSDKLFVAKMFVNGISNNINVYPNPVIDWLWVTGLPIDHSVTLQLFNLMGQNLKKSSSVNGEANIDLRDLQKGTYLIEFDNNYIKPIKILKK